MKQKIISVFMAATLMAGTNQAVMPLAAIRTASASGNVVSVALGDSHSAAITNNGDLYCWGSNDSNQLGKVFEEDPQEPVKIMENVASVALGSSHSAAITKNGDLYCWGSNDSGQIGDGTGEEQDIPVKILIASSGSSSSARVGYRTTVNKMNYEVTKVNANGTGEVALKGTSNKKNNFKSLKVVNNIKIDGKVFKVTSISSNSFSGYSNLQSVIIGGNVTSIGNKAFNNCKKLKKLTINSSKLKSVGNKAINGINKKAAIKVPKKSLKSYKNLFKAKTGYKKTMKIR